MKSFFSLLLLLTINISSVQQSNRINENKTYVWICNSKTANHYHSHEDCRGLKNCKSEIKKVTLKYALSINRKACKICY